MQKYHRPKHPRIYQCHQLQWKEDEGGVFADYQIEYPISHQDDIDLTAKGYK